VTCAAPLRPRVPTTSRRSGEDVRLHGVLEGQRSAILERWRAMIFESYPPESTRFFRSEADPFRNPVGQALLRGTETIYDGALLGREVGPVADALESIVRLRAVQDLPASEAIAFVFWLKRAVREQLREAGAERDLWPASSALDERIDALASTAFELYGRCRERIYQIRVDELRRRLASLLKQVDGPRRGGGSPPTTGGPEGGCEA
jgi:hypothetical protein